MTTGRLGTYHTPWGAVEFTHTKRAASDIVARTHKTERPLRMATVQTAWRDLKRVGRNTQLVDEQVLRDD
jgi:hypothetical protein